MGKVWKKGAAALLAAVMCASALSGCGKNSEAISAFKFNGEKVDGDLANFVLRYEESTLDDMYAYYASMMNQDIWSMDDGQGLGITTWDNFKSTISENLEKLLLAEEHAEDYDVSLTDDEKKKITEAAAAFMSANDKEALESMSATQEIVEQYLTLRTIQAKVEDAMCADVDTNVSDEEAAQRTIGYIAYTPTTEAESETESEMAGTEADVENIIETEADIANVVDTEADDVDSLAMTEGETSVVETEEDTKTKAADDASKSETEASDLAAAVTEEVLTEAEQALTEAEQVLTEAEQALTEAEDALPESESETEDPAMAEAKVKYRAMAEAQLEALQSGEVDFDTAVAQVNEESTPGVSSSTFTFGKDDTYPDAAIITATEGLEDGAIVEEIVEANDAYYILHVNSAFDEAATESKKEEIVNERKASKIDEIYDGWMEEEEFDVDSEVLNALVKERNYTAPVSDETESASSTEAAVSTEAEVAADAVVSTEAEAAADAVVSTEAEAAADAVVSTEAEAAADAVVSTEANAFGETELDTEAELSTEA